MTPQELLQNAGTGVVLVCVSVLIQVTVSLLVVRTFSRAVLLVDLRPSSWRETFVLAGLILLIIVDHLLQIHIWGMAFYQLAYFSDFWTAQYFAAQTYTTLGYGDLLLPPNRRMLAGWLALTGLLMIGWSIALFVYLITEYHQTHRTRAGRGRGERPPRPRDLP